MKVYKFSLKDMFGLDRILNLRKTPEGVILLMGGILGLLYSLVLGVNFFSDPLQFQMMIAMSATHVVFGRAAGISFGVAAGMPQFAVIVINMIVETLCLFVFYPLFVFSCHRLVSFPLLKRFFSNIERMARKNKGTIDKYGLIGLFAFVLFPFWMTGPLAGSVIGFLMGMRPWTVISVVLGGTYGAIFLWAFIIQNIHASVAAYSPYAPMTLVLILIVCIAVGNLIADTRRNHKKTNGNLKNEENENGSH